MKKIQMIELIAPMHGWCSAEKAGILFDLVTDTRANLVVEIGVYAGRSLIAAAAALQELGRGLAVGIDPWRVEPCLEGDNDPANAEWWQKIPLDEIHRLCNETIWSHNLQSYAILVRTCSQYFAPMFPVLIDILHIDGCHSEVASVRDVENYLPMVRHGGYVIMDDTNWATTKQAVAELERCCQQTRMVADEKAGTEFRIYRKG